MFQLNAIDVAQELALLRGVLEGLDVELVMNYASLAPWESLSRRYVAVDPALHQPRSV